MIDTRDYKTHCELVDAMQFEHDIAELDYLSRKLAELEFYKHQYELSIEKIKSRKLELQSNIDEYHKKLKLYRKRERNATYNCSPR